MSSFTWQGHPARVVFGAGSRKRIAEEAAKLGLQRPLLIASPRLAGEIQALCPSAAGTFTETVMHVPIEVAARAVARAQELKADGAIAFGGGSAIGIAKQIALQLGLPVIAAPTTYSGSEMTSVWGRVESGIKKTGRDARVRPKTVIYDPELFVSLPKETAGQSGLNAIAHAMEALYAENIDPLTQLIAEESVARIAAHLPRVANDANPNIDDVAEVLQGAWLAGMCLDGATMGVHHKLAHVLGGTFRLPHAGVHSVILPYAAEFNREAAPLAMSKLARALHTDDAPLGLWKLARASGAPASLAALGMSESDLDRAAEIAVSAPYSNPRPVDRDNINKLLAQAFSGEAPHPMS